MTAMSPGSFPVLALLLSIYSIHIIELNIFLVVKKTLTSADLTFHNRHNTILILTDIYQIRDYPSRNSSTDSQNSRK